MNKVFIKVNDIPCKVLRLSELIGVWILNEFDLHCFKNHNAHHSVFFKIVEPNDFLHLVSQSTPTLTIGRIQVIQEVNINSYSRLRDLFRKSDWSHLTIPSYRHHSCLREGCNKGMRSTHILLLRIAIHWTIPLFFFVLLSLDFILQDDLARIWSNVQIEVIREILWLSTWVIVSHFNFHFVHSKILLCHQVALSNELVLFWVIICEFFDLSQVKFHIDLASKHVCLLAHFV